MIARYLENYNRNDQDIFFSRNEKTFLLVITIIGSLLRIYYQYDREFIGDEVGTIIFIEKSFSYLLSHYEVWLTMNYYIVLEKIFLSLFGKNPISLGFISIFAGICIIPLTAILSRQLTTSRVATIAAGLVAINPYLISYSGIIRSYSLLTAWSLTAIILYIKWHSQHTVKNGIWFSIACFFLLLFHIYGVYTLAFLIILTGLNLYISMTKRHALTVAKTLLIPLLVSMLLFAVSHIKIFPGILKIGSQWHDIPPTSISYLPYIFSEYFGKTYFGLLSLIFLGIGLWNAWKYKKFLLLLSLNIIVPIVLISLQGLSHFPWAYGRFLIFCIPVLIIFISQGLESLTNASILARKQFLGVLILFTLLCASWVPNMTETFQKKRRVSESFLNQAATIIENKYKTNDLILCTDWFSELHLQQYLSKQTYNIVSINDFINNRNSERTGDHIFLLCGSDIKSMFPQYNNEKGTITIYPFRSKNYVLTKINDDLKTSVNNAETNTVNNQLYLILCQINKYMDTSQAGVYCNLWNEYDKKTVGTWDHSLRMKNIFRQSRWQRQLGD